MPQLNRQSDSHQVKVAFPARRTASSSLNMAPLHRALPANAIPATVGQGNRETIPPSLPGQRRTNDVQRKARPAGLLNVQNERRLRSPMTSNAGSALSAERPATTNEKNIKSATLHNKSKKWSRPTLAESTKFSPETEDTGRPRSKLPVAIEKSSEANSEIPMGSRLPPDLLCLCFTKVESLYYLVNCSLVCRAWKEAFLSPIVWKTMYLTWWHDKDENLTSSKDGERILPYRNRPVPEGYSSWQSAFIGRFGEGKKLLVVKERARAVEESQLHVRQVADSRGRRVFDCVPGDGMQKLAGLLGLSFEIRLNNGRPVKVRGRGKIDVFENSCVVRYPASCVSGLNLSALKSIEVAVTSDRLLRVCSLVDHTRLSATSWDVVSTRTPSAGPLRLLQRRLKSGVSMIVGTLAEEIGALSDEINVAEGLLLIALSFHLNDLLWILMQLGDGPSSYFSRTVVRDDANPYFGLHNWSMSMQIHTFGKSIWSRHFRNLVFHPQDSIPGEKAVFLPEPHVEVFPGVLKLPWKSEAFSECLRGVFLLDVTLWDKGGCEIAWRSNSAVRIESAPLAVVEYGIEFDGERVQTSIVDHERGVFLEIEMCIPVNFSGERAGGEKPMIAIRKIKVGMKTNFLQTWCGVANI